MLAENILFTAQGGLHAVAISRAWRAGRRRAMEDEFDGEEPWKSLAW
jgi:hypothetical protein